MDPAIEHLRANAKPVSQGLCAKYVRLALNAGGFDIKPSAHAKYYGKELGRVGFKPVAVYDGKNAKALSPEGYIPGYSPQAGDVVIIQPYPGGNQSGHMAMYDGKIWISDFRQSSMYPGKGYRAARPGYVVYRL